MKHVKTFEQYEHPEEIDVGQIWYGGCYDYEYDNGDCKKKDKYFIVITSIDEELFIIRYNKLNKKTYQKIGNDADIMASFLDRFQYVCDKIKDIDVTLTSQKYNL